ncbi:hypothetical protein [uncultured Porphyromonas sp.]|uniref:hypothetical protein n=1 Tax=uncultured Porphyromonas sp. TaxID=159274 RepID=UPI0026189194|nr:hypothetical protein [uncultured Porphyromonas sp.]
MKNSINSMLKKKLKAILTIALLGVALGAFPSCHKDNKEPVSKIPQLAGTHWEGTITDTEYGETHPCKVIFFSDSVGEATLPMIEDNWSEPPSRDFWEYTTPFSYSVGNFYIKFKADMSEYSGSLDMVNSVKRFLHGYWLIKSFTEDELTCYRTPGSEIIVTLKRVL